MMRISNFFKLSTFLLVIFLGFTSCEKESLVLTPSENEKESLVLTPSENELGDEIINKSFKEWFSHWQKFLDNIVTIPPGRPCLYSYQYLVDNYTHIRMNRGDYFPSWRRWSLRVNLNFIRELVVYGNPIRDTYVDSKGNLIPPRLGSVIEQERLIITNGGYSWNKISGQWEK